MATTNGTKARDTLEKQVRNQMLWYQPDGIFLDEMNYSKGQSAAGGTVRDYYTWISGIIRQGPANRDGSAKMVIGNPGNVSESQGDWALVRPAAGVPPVVDILVVFEGFAKDYKTWPQPKWVYPGTDRAHAYRIAHLVHDVREHPFSQERAITELSRKHHAGYVYVTTETTGTQATGNPYTDNILWNMLAPSWFSRIGPTPPVRLTRLGTSAAWSENKTPPPPAGAGKDGVFVGAPPGTRTRNPLIKSQLLCQLS